MTEYYLLAKLIRILSHPQRRMIIASEPDDITGEEGCGVELHGAGYATAKVLKELGLGVYTHGSPIGDLYWNNVDGLKLRTILLERGHA